MRGPLIDDFVDPPVEDWPVLFRISGQAAEDNGRHRAGKLCRDINDVSGCEDFLAQLLGGLPHSGCQL
ncbi:hypothetical protein D9M69_651580 [compost metagenome]